MTPKDGKAEVFFLPWDRRDELASLLERAGAARELKKGDYVAIKMHFGERGGEGFIEPKYVRPVLKLIRDAKAKAYLTDTNTIYHGPRNNAVGHLTVAAEHGFTQTKLQTPVVIADGLKGDDYRLVEVKGDHFSSVKVATGVYQADFLMVLSHFKGHLLTGFGGALKNLGMGCGARVGKFEMHSSVAPTYESQLCEKCGACVKVCAQTAITLGNDGIALDGDKCVGCGECVVACPYGALKITWNEGAASVQERYVEYAAGAVRGKRAFYVNFVNHITANCDCMGLKEKSIAPDIGILASTDPLAIDQASLDMVTKAAGDVFRTVHPEVDYTVQLTHAERMGLGARDYEIIEI
jgi:uncharacterized Fe-S center protein